MVKVKQLTGGAFVRVLGDTHICQIRSTQQGRAAPWLTPVFQPSNITSLVVVRDGEQIEVDGRTYELMVIGTHYRLEPEEQDTDRRPQYLGKYTHRARKLGTGSYQLGPYTIRRLGNNTNHKEWVISHQEHGVLIGRAWYTYREAKQWCIRQLGGQT